jgi:hypothetical protein
MRSLCNPSVNIQTSSCPIPSTPSWFGEVTVLAHYLRRVGALTAIAERVRFARRRFGHYEAIDGCRPFSSAMQPAANVHW